jgi:hypothetical protein
MRRLGHDGPAVFFAGPATGRALAHRSKICGLCDGLIIDNFIGD